MEMAQIAIAVLAFIACFVLTGKAIYHMWFVVTNVTGKYANFLGPLLLFMPNQFNEVDNKHRASLGSTLIRCIGMLASSFPFRCPRKVTEPGSMITPNTALQPTGYSGLRPLPPSAELER